MMHWSDIPFQPPRKTLRQFAWLWIAFFGGFAVWQALVRGNSTPATVFAVLALTIGPIGLARPEWLRPIYVAWMVLAFPIGWAVSQAVTAVLFYRPFTPIGLVFRLIGRDPLHRSPRPGGGAAWSPHPRPSDPPGYFPQF